MTDLEQRILIPEQNISNPEQSIVVPKEIKPKEISASMLTTLFGCSLAFYFQYIAHEKVPDTPPLTFGRKIHYMLKLFYDRNFKAPDSFASFWRGYWYRSLYLPELDSEGKPIKEKGRVVFKKDENGKPILDPNIDWWDPGSEPHSLANIGEGILSKFYQNHKQLSKPAAYEKPFRKINFKGHLLRGVWDRITLIDTGLVIADYKTDRISPADSEKKLNELHRSVQFTIYSRAFRELTGREEENLLFYHLRSGITFKTARGKKEYDYLESLLDKAQRIIDDENYTPFYGFHCSMCRYREPCNRIGIGVDAKLKKIYLEGKEKPRIWNEWDREIKIKDPELRKALALSEER